LLGGALLRHHLLALRNDDTVGVGRLRPCSLTWSYR